MVTPQPLMICVGHKIGCRATRAPFRERQNLASFAHAMPTSLLLTRSLIISSPIMARPVRRRDLDQLRTIVGDLVID
jgi:hypothetical protein